MSTAGASHSQSSECQLQKLIPCYFALTSEPNLPLKRELCPQQESGANSKQEKTTLVEKAELPHLGQYYGYTLKLVQSGLLILTWGKNENNVAAFYCDKGKFTQISDNIPGLSSGDHFVSVPQCAGETFKVCYLHTLPEERDLAIASWKEIVKNLEGHEWQQITLCKKPYSLHWKDAVPLIEDFRGKRGGKLDFLATWSESKRALNPEERNIFKEKWIAAEDDPLTTRTAAIPEGVPILLHDPVGQIQDCRKAYLLSLRAFHNFCRLHSPLISSGFTTLAGLVELKKQEQKLSEARIQRLIKDFNLAPSRPKFDLAFPPAPPPFGMQSESPVSPFQVNYRDWLPKQVARPSAWGKMPKYQKDFDLATSRPKSDLELPPVSPLLLMQSESALATHQINCRDWLAKPGAQTQDFDLATSRPKSDPESPPSPPPFLMQSESALAEYHASYRDWLAKPGARTWAWDEMAKCKKDFTYCPPYPLNAPKKALYSIMQEEFSGFKNGFFPYLQDFFMRHTVLIDGLKCIVQTWIKLLSSSTPNSFQKLLATGLKYDKGGVKQIDADFVDPLLLLRDAIFCRTHANIGDIPSLPFFMDFSKDLFKELEKDFFPTLKDDFPTLESGWEKIKKAQSDFLDDVRDALFTKEYLNFFCGTLGSGIYPTEAAGALLMNILSLFVYSPQATAHEFLAALAKRMGLAAPQETPLTFMDILCGFGLQSNFHFVKMEEVLQTSNKDNWSIATKAVNGFDALKNPFIKWLAGKNQKIQDHIDNLKKFIDINTGFMKKSMENMEKILTEMNRLFDEAFPLYSKNLELDRLIGEANKLNTENRYYLSMATSNTKYDKSVSIATGKRYALEGVSKGASFFVGGALLFINLRNCFTAAKDLITAPDTQNTPGMTVFNLLSIASPILSIADLFKNVLLSKQIARVIAKANITVSFIATFWEMGLLVNKRNPGAAIGIGLMGIPTTALPLVLTHATLATALSFVCFAALGFFVGLCIYIAYKDSQLEELLKNCLWNNHNYPLIQKLRQATVPYSHDIKVKMLWKDAIRITAESLRLLCSIEPQFHYDKEKDILCIKFEAPCGHGVRFDYDVFLSYMDYHGSYMVALKENDLLEPPFFEETSGIFKFYARYHIKKRLHEHSSQTLVSDSIVTPVDRKKGLNKDDISAAYENVTIHLTVQYRFSSDIDYGTIKKQEDLAAIIKQSSSTRQAS